MVCESDPDPIDSLSRGYEYLFRRPMQLIWYGVVSVILCVVAGRMIDGVGLMTLLIIRSIALAFSPDATLIGAATATLALLMFSWKSSLALALLGGSYLLLRRDANGQDVEDFWQPVQAAEESLPQLPPEAYQS